MQELRYEELENRAAFAAEPLDAVRKAEARSSIFRELQKMRAEGKALTLTEEEENLLWSFRRFKLRMRKDGEVFTWQTRRPEGVQVVGETAEIILPSEVLR